jgi:hypothetical protein
MAAPNQVEIANMGTWNIYRHYYRYRQMYVNQGSAIAAGIRTILQKVQSITQAQPPNLTVAEDDIASAFRSFLLNDANWTTYLGRKAHMTGPVHLVMTDTMARFIAWEAYVDITR